MSTNSYARDRWLLPRQQTEYPARDLLPEATVHGRREATFLVLAAVVLVTTSALVLIGTSRTLDVSALLASIAPGMRLRMAVLLPLGALPFALSFVASALVCELFGRRRAMALFWVGGATSAALVGFVQVADRIDGGAAFAGALALAACCVVAHASNVVVFAALRRGARGRLLFARVSVAALVAQVLGWAAFAAVLHVTSGQLGLSLAIETIVALATGAAVWSSACVLVLAIPVAVATRGLALALRVARDPSADDEHDTEPAFAEGSVVRKLPPAVIVEDAEPGQEEGRGRRAASVPPFSSAEMRFFRDGELM